MSKIVLITGGSKSGKSTFAEKILENQDEVLYIATSIVTDKEMEKRVKIHKERRNSKWKTHEGYKNLYKVIRECKENYIMLECIGTMVTNLMFDKEHDFETMNSSEILNMQKEIKEEITKFLKVVRECDKNLIIVTNEVGWSLVSEHRLGRIFSDMLGGLNQHIGSLCDEAYLVSCGFPLKLK